LYSITYPEVKQKLQAEIDPLMAKHIDNLADYSMDDADDGLIYTKMAYLESLRIEPPASVTSIQTFSRDVTLVGKKVGNT
jgi:cytochrome P450